MRDPGYFVAVAATESLTLAAQSKLDTSRPSLSRQVLDLEEEIGAQLMMRTARWAVACLGTELSAFVQSPSAGSCRNRFSATESRTSYPILKLFFSKLDQFVARVREKAQETSKVPPVRWQKFGRNTGEQEGTGYAPYCDGKNASRVTRGGPTLADTHRELGIPTSNFLLRF